MPYCQDPNCSIKSLLPRPIPGYSVKKMFSIKIFWAAVYKKAFNTPDRQNTPNTGNRGNTPNRVNRLDRVNRGNTLDMLDTPNLSNESNTKNMLSTQNPSSLWNMKKAFKYNHHQGTLKTKAILDEQG